MSTTQSTTTVHLPIETAIALIEARGWKVDTQNSARGEFSSYTLPGRTPRSLGGSFGHDYLWELDEALTQALSAEV